MTAELLLVAKSADITITVECDCLDVDAPAIAWTPELESEVARHKAALVVMLARTTQFVTVRGGLTVPLSARNLALDLEWRGYRLSLDSNQQAVVEPAATLTEADLAGIRRWRHHLGAIISYNADAYEPIQ